MKVTRRTFICSSSLAVVGWADGAWAQGAPAAPGAPVLTDPEKSRASTALTLTWTSVPDVDSYDVQLTDSSTTSVVNAGLSFNSFTVSGLTPNRTYAIAVRALRNGLASPFSPELKVPTRPPTPAIAQQSPGQLIDGSQQVTMQWSEAGSAAASDDAANLRVIVGTSVDGAIISALTPDDYAHSLPLQADFTEQYRGADKYYVRFIGMNADAPGGLNLSAWSEGVPAVITLFGELRVPGLQEIARANLNTMRRYYA